MGGGDLPGEGHDGDHPTQPAAALSSTSACRACARSGGTPGTMPRLLQVSSVRLGARHVDLGTAGREQRERQWAAFEAALSLATREHCDAVLIAGDLFDSNAQPRRTIDRAAAALGRLVAQGIAVVILPGATDPYDASSIYRTYDLAAIAGLPSGADGPHVLVPGRMTVVLPALDLAVRGYAADGATLDAAFAAPPDEAERGIRLRVGIARAVPGAEGATGVSQEAIAASGLDYLALGGAPAPAQGEAGTTRWADPGPPELLGEGGDEVGQVLLVTLEAAGSRRVRIEPRPVGRSRRLRTEVDVSDIPDEAALLARLGGLADADLACEVRITGTRPAGLKVDEAALEAALATRFLHLRVHDASLPPTPEAPLVADSIAGNYTKDRAALIAAAAAEGRTGDERDAREQLDLGMHIIAGSTGMPV